MIKISDKNKASYGTADKKMRRKKKVAQVHVSSSTDSEEDWFENATRKEPTQANQDYHSW